ncbi:Leucine-rich repeat extensin-like protein 7 [Linum grandiflorum]
MQVVPPVYGSVAASPPSHHHPTSTPLTLLSNLGNPPSPPTPLESSTPESAQMFVSKKEFSELDLSNNQFPGNFPIPVLYIPNLLYLDLRFNSFTGPIPDNLFDKRLDVIFLNNNQFQGSTPINFKKLQYQGSGTIPALADEEMGEDDEYDDLYNNVNVGENFLQMHRSEPPIQPANPSNGTFPKLLQHNSKRKRMFLG